MIKTIRKALVIVPLAAIIATVYGYQLSNLELAISIICGVLASGSNDTASLR